MENKNVPTHQPESILKYYFHENPCFIIFPRVLGGSLIIPVPRHVHLPSREKRQRLAPLAPSFATAGGGVKASLLGAFGQTKMWVIYYRFIGIQRYSMG
jgi:hypothetical protein